MALAAFFLSVAVWFGSGPVTAHVVDQQEIADKVKSGEIMSLEKVLAVVRKQYPGELLDSQLIDQDGDYFYEIKILTHDGMVRIVTVDARNGQVTSVR